MILLSVAIALPTEVQDRVAALCAGLTGTRWTEAENLHLTVRFIGDVDNAGLADIDAALMQLRAPAFSLTLSGVGSFGNAGGVRAVWVGVHRDPLLQHLRDKIESALVRTGLAPEKQKFKPHVTLTRSRRRGDSRLQEFMAQHSLFQAGPFAVEGFMLFSSFLSHNGAIYTPERLYPLKPS